MLEFNTLIRYFAIGSEAFVNGLKQVTDKKVKATSYVMLWLLDYKKKQNTYLQALNFDNEGIG